MMSVKISAYIEDDIKEKMEHYSAAHGLKEGYLIQNALDYYLNVLHEIPSSFIIPSQLSVTEENFKTIMELENKEPNEKLKALMHEN
jgi:cAMP phosphodiesterase